MRNEVLLEVIKERNIIGQQIERRLSGLVTSCEGTALYNTLLKEI